MANLPISAANNLPWYKRAEMERDRREYYKKYAKKPVDAIHDLAVPAIYHIGEIIHSDDKPPQVRLQAAQIVINKCISDKIDIIQQNQVVDINRLIDQAMAISSIAKGGISNTYDNDVIEVSPLQEGNDK